MVEKSPISDGDVIAIRELIVVDSTDIVVVRLGKPYKVSEGEAICSYRITYRDVTYGCDIHGVDMFQALDLALKNLPTFLRHTPALPLGRMYAFEPGDDMGFPEVYTDEYFNKFGPRPDTK